MSAKADACLAAQRAALINLRATLRAPANPLLVALIRLILDTRLAATAKPARSQP